MEVLPDGSGVQPVCRACHELHHDSAKPALACTGKARRNTCRAELLRYPNMYSNNDITLENVDTAEFLLSYVQSVAYSLRDEEVAKGTLLSPMPAALMASQISHTGLRRQSCSCDTHG